MKVALIFVQVNMLPSKTTKRIAISFSILANRKMPALKRPQREGRRKMKNSSKRSVVHSALLMCMAIVVGLLIRYYICEVRIVLGESMLPTLQQGNIVLVNKLDNNYETMDVVVIAHGKSAITKRIVGCPGDTVQIKGGIVYINGSPLQDVTSETTDYPGIAKTSGRALTDTIQQQAASFGAEFMLAEATGFDLDGDIKTVHTHKGDYRCFGILLATGAHPRMVGFKGEEEYKGRGVAYCATCDGEFFTGKEIFVVGGGYAAARNHCPYLSIMGGVAHNDD